MVKTMVFMENDIILRTFADWLRGVIDPAGQVGHSDGQALPPSLGLQGGATSTTLAHAAESGPFSVPHECLRWATNLSCRNGSNKAERYMQKAPAETKAMKCNQRQRERSHTIILPHAPLNQCCFSQTGDLLASKYSTASLPRIQVQWNNQLWFRGEGFLYGAGYFLCCREKHAKRMDQWQRLL